MFPNKHPFIIYLGPSDIITSLPSVTIRFGISVKLVWVEAKIWTVSNLIFLIFIVSLEEIQQSVGEDIKEPREEDSKYLCLNWIRTKADVVVLGDEVQ